MAIIKRKIRFVPDEDGLGSISFNPTEFQEETSVLIINESVHGACLVISKKLLPHEVSIIEGLSLFVKIGNLEPELAIVRWAKQVDDDLIKIGIERE